MTNVSRAAVHHWRARWRALHWAERAARDDEEAWSLPLVVRAEKARPPDHQHAVYAAALAVARLLADPESAPGGPWHDALERWMDGRIRKVVRRARGVRWTEAEAQPGVTAEVGSALVRAVLPHPVSAAPPVIDRLQVQGLHLEADPDCALARFPSAPADPTLTILLAPRLAMSTGKACAQVGHAAQLGVLELEGEQVDSWLDADLPLRVVEAAPSVWARVLRGHVRAAIVQDAGFTEVEPGTRTCAATFAHTDA